MFSSCSPFHILVVYDYIVFVMAPFSQPCCLGHIVFVMAPFSQPCWLGSYCFRHAPPLFATLLFRVILFWSCLPPFFTTLLFMFILFSSWPPFHNFVVYGHIDFVMAPFSQPCCLGSYCFRHASLFHNLVVYSYIFLVMTPFFTTLLFIVILFSSWHPFRNQVV